MGVAAWNCLATLEHGDHAGDRYPVPTGDKRVVQPEPGEQGAQEWKFTEFSVHYLVKDEWTRTRYVSGQDNPGKVIVTSTRTVFAFKKVPKNSSFFVPLAAVQQLSQGVKNRGKSTVGHIRHEWLASISARNASMGFGNNSPALRFTVLEPLGGRNVVALVEIQPSGRSDPARIGDVVIAQVIRNRLDTTTLADDDREALLALTGRRLNPPARNFDTVRLPGNAPLPAPPASPG